MIKFLTKILVFGLVLIVVYSALGFFADGYTDPFYLRFTTSKQKSMVLGTSRAAQGIVPSVFRGAVSEGFFEGNLYNYSFTVMHSPYGETYYKAIKEKLNRDTEKGLFIVTVDPWSISSRSDIDYDRETKLELSKISTFNGVPNYDYLRNAYKGSFFNLLIDKMSFKKNTKSIPMLLNNDGWLEVFVDTSKQMILKGSKDKIKDYRDNQLHLNKISKKRMFYLEKTIKLLKLHGKVILVRMPVDKRMLVIENMLDPVFNDRLTDLSLQHGVKYLVYDDDGYIFPDGNHLYRASSKKFSLTLAKDINDLYLNE